MSILAEIPRTWVKPRQVMRQQILSDHREARLLGYAVSACIVILIGQVPRLFAASVADPGIAFEARFSAAALGWLFFAPLVLYALAALSRFVAKLAGGKGQGRDARLALFWSLLASAPLWLLSALVSIMTGGGLIANLIGLLALLAFASIWFISLHEAETGEPRA